MKTKHTPGPWKESQTVAGSICGESGRLICSMWGNEHNEETQANARLIAEAGTVATETGLTPRQLAEQRAELLKAAKQALFAMIEDENALRRLLTADERASIMILRTAIAKAEKKE